MPRNNSSTFTPQAFGVDGIGTTLQKMKARYQYNDEEIQDLQKEYNSTLQELAPDLKEALAADPTAEVDTAKLDWVPRPEPGVDSAGASQEYYVEARRDLSIQTIKHTLLLQARLAGLEDELLQILERMLLAYSKLRTEHIRTSDLGRIQRMLESIKNSNSMFQEATSVPSALDPDKAPEEMESDKKWVLEIIKAVKEDSGDAD